MNRSRSGQVGFDGSWRITSKYSVVRISTAEREPPGWPDFASPIISMILRRTRLAIVCSSATSFVFFMLFVVVTEPLHTVAARFSLRPIAAFTAFATLTEPRQYGAVP